MDFGPINHEFVAPEGEPDVKSFFQFTGMLFNQLQEFGVETVWNIQFFHIMLGENSRIIAPKDGEVK